MIGLVVSMLRMRRTQALTLLLLATFTIGSAAAVPAFLDAADRAVIATEVAHALPGELTVSATAGFTAAKTQVAVVPDRTFEQAVPPVMDGSGFTPVFGAQTDAFLAGRTDHSAYPRLLFRQDACAHIALYAGRCPVATGEVMLTPDYASALGLHVGDTAPMRWAILTKGDGWKPSSLPPITASIVGTYRPRAANEPYWGTVGFFGPGADRLVDSPILTARGTLIAMVAPHQTQYVDGVLDPARLAPGRLAAIRTGAVAAIARADGDGATTGTQIPTLISQIDRDRATLRPIVTLAALPLVVLGWAVLFLAGGYAISGRREELGVVALRGASRPSRWWLGAGEGLCAVLLAIPGGVLVGYAFAWLTARLLLAWHPGTAYASGPALHLAPAVPYVAVAVAGSALAIVAAARGTLATPTADLLRAVASRQSRWRSAAMDVAVVALAAVSVGQLQSQQGSLRGVEIVAPALVIAAIAVLAARIVPAIASFVGARALRGGGRLGIGPGIGLGALQLARRPGVARMFALLVVAVGLVTFTVSGYAAAEATTRARARIELGAPRVVTVQALTRQALLDGVRKADPQGRYAMAVAQIAQPNPAAPPILAVDATRLVTVASWPAGDMPVATAAALLHPPVAAPLGYTGYRIALDMSIGASTAALNRAETTLQIELQPHDGGPSQAVTLVPGGGRQTYAADTPWCGGGCDVIAIALAAPGYFNRPLAYTLHALRVLTPAPSVVTRFDGAWQVVVDAQHNDKAQITPAVGGLGVSGAAGPHGVVTVVKPADSAYPVPALSAAQLGDPFQGLVGGLAVPMNRAGAVPTIPRFAGNGIIVDLANVDLASPSFEDTAVAPEVWLGAGAPADAMARLVAAGLPVSGSRTITGEIRYLGGQGPAVGRRFDAYAAAAILLLAIGVMGLAATVDRVRRRDELRALRMQGLSVRRVGDAALTSQVGLAVGALVLGPAAGALAWRITGTRIPVFADGSTLATVPRWPQWTIIGWSSAGVAAVLLGVAIVAAWDLRRVVRHSDVMGSSR